MMIPFFKNKRVGLRAVEPEDCSLVYELENDVDEWIYSERIAPLSMHAIESYALTTQSDPFIEKQLRLMVLTEDCEICGIADLYDVDVLNRTAFVGIIILKKYRGKGYATEALDAMEKYCCRHLRLRMLGAKIATTNIGSIRLFEKRGYMESGVMKRWLDTPSGPTDMVIMQRDLENHG